MSDPPTPQQPFVPPPPRQPGAPGAPGARPHPGQPGPWSPGQVQPGYRPGFRPPPRPVPTGDGAWWVGLVVFAVVPFLSSVAAGVTQWLVGRSQRQYGPLAWENGRRAANWGLTYLLGTLVLVGGHFFLLWFLTLDGATIRGFFPFGIIISLWMLYTLIHIVVSIWGGLVAKSGRVFRMNGLPFLRP